eukprot:CAMPEP_0113955164 /NCGR_PEP_ID=MMETSP0011_2-20120614/1108_1 /TAXON_ID=101924 /ORGANISM="Rhodosorus marinus" /LENGTH=429 /DNA_ID=CAMNT_0000964677 /DNA_START=413 /DNA_END=1702 /DNA_ORIENTATION=+ /assembly_acc=CAM_ASM_000156
MQAKTLLGASGSLLLPPRSVLLVRNTSGQVQAATPEVLWKKKATMLSTLALVGDEHVSWRKILKLRKIEGPVKFQGQIRAGGELLPREVSELVDLSIHCRDPFDGATIQERVIEPGEIFDKARPDMKIQRIYSSESKELKAFLRFCATYVAKMHYRSATDLSNGLRILENDQFLLNELAKDLQIFAPGTRTNIKGRHSMFEMTINNPSLLHVMQDLCGSSPKAKRLPSFTFTLADPDVMEFLQSYIAVGSLDNRPEGLEEPVFHGNLLTSSSVLMLLTQVGLSHLVVVDDSYSNKISTVSRVLKNLKNTSQAGDSHDHLDLEDQPSRIRRISRQKSYVISEASAGYIIEIEDAEAVIHAATGGFHEDTTRNLGMSFDHSNLPPGAIENGATGSRHMKSSTNGLLDSLPQQVETTYYETGLNLSDHESAR